MRFVKDTISIHGTIGRLPFALWGVALFILKYNLNRVTHVITFNEDWLITPYFIRPDRLIHLAFENAQHPLFIALLIYSIPLLLLGLLLTYKRIKDIGLHPIWTLFFFFPWVNLPMLGLLAIIPGTTDALRSDRKDIFINRLIPRTKLGSAWLALGMLILFFVPIPMLSIPYVEKNMLFSAAWIFFLGLFSGLIYSHHTERSLGANIKVGAATMAILLTIVVSLLILSMFYFWMTGQEEILYMIIGSMVYLIIPFIMVVFLGIPSFFAMAILGSTVAYFIMRYLPFRSPLSITKGSTY